jgi:hypothetical protein
MKRFQVPSHFGRLLFDVEDFVMTYREHICPEVIQLAAHGTLVTEAIEAKLYARHGLNSYDRHVLYLMMTPECLIKTLETTLANCQRISRPLPGCYDEAVVQVFTPLLIWHLQEQMKRKTVWEKIKQIFSK